MQSHQPKGIAGSRVVSLSEMHSSATSGKTFNSCTKILNGPKRRKTLQDSASKLMLFHRTTVGVCTGLCLFRRPQDRRHIAPCSDPPPHGHDKVLHSCSEDGLCRSRILCEVAWNVSDTQVVDRAGFGLCEEIAVCLKMFEGKKIAEELLLPPLRSSASPLGSLVPPPPATAASSCFVGWHCLV